MQHQWVNKNTRPHKHFDTEKETKTFKEARHEFLKKNFTSTSAVQQNQNSSLYETPSSMDHTSATQPLEKVSNIKIVGCGSWLSSWFIGIFFQPCLYPMKNLHLGRMYTAPHAGVQGGLPPCGVRGQASPRLGFEGEALKGKISL